MKLVTNTTRTVTFDNAEGDAATYQIVATTAHGDEDKHWLIIDSNHAEIWLPIDELRELVDAIDPPVESMTFSTPPPADDAAMDPGPPAEVRMEQQTHINARKWLEVMHKGNFWTKGQAVVETVRAFQIPESIAQAIADEVWGVEIGKPPYAPEPGEGIPL